MRQWTIAINFSIEHQELPLEITAVRGDETRQ